MRSSPSCSVASRSEASDGQVSDEPSPGGEGQSVSVSRSRRESDELNEFTIHLKLSYKTVLLVVVVLDVLHISMRELVSTGTLDHVIQGFGF